jgi:diguanylate cyclase (GGDEF)-like protein
VNIVVPKPVTDGLFSSYAQLTQNLCEHVTGVCLLNANLSVRGVRGQLEPDSFRGWVGALEWGQHVKGVPRAKNIAKNHWLTAIPIQHTDGQLLAVLGVLQRTNEPAVTEVSHTRALLQRLQPVMDSLYRELSAAAPKSSRNQTLTERTAELEWLFKIAGTVRGSSGDPKTLDSVLSAATERIGAGVGILVIPDKRLRLECQRRLPEVEALQKIAAQTETHLLTWATRQQRPLLINGGAGAKMSARCKILSVPLVRDSGRLIGIMAFFNASVAVDFAPRHVFLARHLGRQMASLVDSQFDLMTGLYTRDGIEQIFAQLSEQQGAAVGSVIYIDLDHMHVVNELHGFELGNELIVRVAELLAPPLVPEGTISARISGDRFALVLPESDSKTALQVAQALQRAAKSLKIGPPREPVDVSISCGVAALVTMPQGLSRALAAAELACKGAKKHGRDRVEAYACEDDSMMRRHDDVVAVGKLRTALKTDGLVLYAQRIVPLQQNTKLAGGYEVLMRLRERDGTLISAGPLIAAAQRYQLLPSVDRWVVSHTLPMLASYRSLLKSSGISISINVSGQSIGDEAFTTLLLEQLKNSQLPAGAVMVEITEQAAVTSLARASDMVTRMASMGCRIALDDFGTGANSLAYLKGLQVSRVKIDGSFVRDVVSNRRSQATVRGIVELARGFAIDTVAEFVENQEIAETVRQLGVDYAQGYAFGKPEPLDGLLRKLGSDESRRLHKLFLEM